MRRYTKNRGHTISKQILLPRILGLTQLRHPLPNYERL